MSMKGDIDLKDEELWKHFRRNFATNEFQCIYCGKGGKISDVNNVNLSSHLFNHHQQNISKVPQKKPIIKITSTPHIMENFQVNNMSDQWLDRLALDGYPIKQILSSILRRFREDKDTFAKYMVRRTSSLRNSKYKVKNFLPKLPITMQNKQIIPLLTDKYRISPEGAQLLLQDYHWVYQNEYEVLSQLTRRGMTIIKHEQNRTNAVILFCDEQMRSSFERFGDVVCIDFKPIKFKQNSKSKCNYHVGVFAGQDTNLHHTLFAVALTIEDKYEYYMTAVKYFIKAMKINSYPQSFIVGSYGTLYKVLKDLNQYNTKYGQQTFGCFLGWHYLTDRLTKIYSVANMEAKQKQQLIRKFVTVLSSLNKQQMEYKASQLLRIYPHETKLHQFISENIQYFPANCNPTFVGFGIEKQNFAMLYKIMYNFLREVENFGIFFQKCLKMQEILLGRIQNGYENMSSTQLSNLNIRISDELQFLNRRLQRRLFKKFLYLYAQAVKNIKVVGKSEDNQYYHLCHKAQSNPKIIYHVKYYIQQQCWKCNCNFIETTGIPCSHLIKIIRKFRGSLTYYINKRWMIHNSRFDPQMPIYQQELTMQAQRQSDNETQEQNIIKYNTRQLAHQTNNMDQQVNNSRQSQESEQQKQENKEGMRLYDKRNTQYQQQHKEQVNGHAKNQEDEQIHQQKQKQVQVQQQVQLQPQLQTQGEVVHHNQVINEQRYIQRILQQSAQQKLKAQEQQNQNK